MKSIENNKKFEFTKTVEEENLAVNVKSGSLRVLATPTLAAWMEEAACELLKDYLEGEETTVGTSLELKHNAPTPLGAQVKIEVTLTAANGRGISFEISAYDNSSAIAECKHERFIVYKTKFQQKADARIN